jgi:ABC-type dipeptide/oligopeptide/nickel transport system permease component
MARFLLRRALHAILVIAGVACLTFFVLRLVPGDPARMILPPGTAEESVQLVRTQLGTDQPLPVQFERFIEDLARGDLGFSFRYRQPVLAIVLRAYPATLALAAAAMLTALVVSIPLGILAALRRGGLLDRMVLVLSVGGQSLPNFWVGVMLVLLFAVDRPWFPAIGMDGWRSFVLPTATLALVLVAVLIRTLRQSMIEALGEDYVRTARAKGLASWRVVFVHAFKNALPPFVTVAGLQVGFILGGAFVVELIFNWPGVGRLALEAIQARDFPLVQGVVILVAAAFILANLLVDLIYAGLNPRVRLGWES